jgi:hypothetical protein
LKIRPIERRHKPFAHRFVDKSVRQFGFEHYFFAFVQTFRVVEKLLTASRRIALFINRKDVAVKIRQFQKFVVHAAAREDYIIDVFIFHKSRNEQRNKPALRRADNRDVFRCSAVFQKLADFGSDSFGVFFNVRIFRTRFADEVKSFGAKAFNYSIVFIRAVAFADRFAP